MSRKRKLELYEMLFKHFGPREQPTTLEEVSVVFGCSARHGRTLLQQMASLQWLSWQASPGRGKRALLHCHKEPMKLCYQLMEQLLEEGRPEAAFALFGFNQRHSFSELKRYVACSTLKSIQKLRIPFHRSIGQLHPHHAQERTERHLILHLFQRLVDDKQGILTGGVAHHWEVDETGCQWLFYLREGIQFHDQTPMTVHDVVMSLRALTLSSYWQPLYSHLSEIDMVSEHVIRINLSHPDWYLPELLARAEASIMAWRHGRIVMADEIPVGSGAFMLDIFSVRVVRLKRHMAFSGEHALLEQIELWIHPDWAAEKPCAEHYFYLDQPNRVYRVTRSDVGYYYLLFNNPALRSQQWGQEILEVVRQHRTCFEEPAVQLTIMSENTSVGRDYLQQINRASSGHSLKLQCVERPFGCYQQGVDLTLGSIRIEGSLIPSLLAFFYSYPFWSSILLAEEYAELGEFLHQIRGAKERPEAERLCRQLLSWLSDQRILTVLRKEDFAITAPCSLQGIEINDAGWCDFTKLWIKGETG
ncbi:SgrR family transcriptional regulator [Dongshaea marina]|uniref:SgrR family transcriptional regulator n=1 Tax=Dongshaea marina TaxID=2047966 RepID=UPI000D3E2109|nr:SgrR family transcriptional regulator [Dongshaea marina]